MVVALCGDHWSRRIFDVATVSGGIGDAHGREDIGGRSEGGGRLDVVFVPDGFAVARGACGDR